MGFYGNITNSTRTQFSFDYVYPSRYDMDTSAGEDHVYVGRYVLVEYDSDTEGSLSGAITAYKVVNKQLKQNFVFCISPELIITKDNKQQINTDSVLICGDKTEKNIVQKGTLIKIPGDSKHNQTLDENENALTEYWICTGDTSAIYNLITKDDKGKETVTQLSFKTAEWKYIGTTADTSYAKNYNKDIATYGTSRGYDSTVWQKVLQEGYEKYVMVAELNTVVPSFDISADAPTMTPLMPHFDSNSTNVYYKLHWQPSWGFRVRSSSTFQTPQFLPSGEIQQATISTSNTDTVYPSDEEMVWERTAYDKTTNAQQKTYANIGDGGVISWTEKDPIKDIPTLPAAIYYNKAGLNSDKVVKSWDNTYYNIGNSYSEKRSNVDPEVDTSDKMGFVQDEIKVMPSGLSGQSYENHNGIQTCAPDTQEVSIMLPSIGDAISDVWDMVYGGRACNNHIKDTGKRNKDIEWYDARAVQDRGGLRLVQDGFTYRNNSGSLIENKQDYYNTANVNTVAGCINSVHDLMGMIIQPYANGSKLTEDLKNNTEDIIYYNQDDQKYYRKDTCFTYTAIPDSDYTYERIDLSEGEFRPDLYFVLSDGKYVVASGTYNSNQEYYIRRLNKNSSFTKVTLDAFDGRKYYYKNRLSNGMCDYISEEEYQRDKKYYTMDSSKIDATRIDLGEDFTPHTYYIYRKKDPITGATLDTPRYEIDYYPTGETYQPTQTYYKIKEVFALKDVDSQPSYVDLYLPGIFYYKAWNKDVYSELYWDGSRPGTAVYIKDTDGEYTEVTNPVEGDTYYEKLHAKGDPYTEKNQDKESFEYVIDNTENGVGSKATDKKGNALFTNLIDHYMVKSGEKVVETYTEVDWYAPISFGGDTGYIYQVNTYYVFSTKANDYVLSADPYNANTQYYEKQKKYIYTYKGGTIDENNPLHLLPYKTNTVRYIDPTTKNKLTRENIGSKNLWYLKRETKDEYLNRTYVSYLPVTSTSIRKYLVDFYTSENRDSTDRLQYYQLDLEEIKKFYYPNKFYYKVGEDKDSKYQGSYILETNSSMKVQNKANYTLAHLTINENSDSHAVTGKNFYYPNHFYKKDGNEYVLAQEKTMNSGETYYEDTRYYVDKDTANIMKHGQAWNTNIKHVPPTVTLAKRTIGYTYYELVDFARKLNTIHGMILKMNQIIDSEDTDTRDLQTVQGALNTFNDWISHLGELNSQEFVIVDNYGRMHSAPISTTQTSEGLNHAAGTKSDVTGIKSDVYPMANSLTSADFKNQWLTVNIDGKPTNPQIAIRHNFQPVKDTTSTSNVNGNGDTIKLYTPIVDPKGHVVGHNDNTVTLPFGFKTITTNGRSDTDSGDNTGTPSKSNVVADNTQDILGINSGNKWIKIDTNATTDTITISHDIHTPTLTAKGQTDLNNSAVDSITIQDITFDNAGHMTGNQTHKYILPYSFKTIKTNGRVTKDNKETLETQNNVVADNTQDTLTLNSGNEWVRITTDATTDTITISHDVKTTSEDSSTATLSNASSSQTFSVTTYDFDTTNHFSKKHTKTYTMPNGYGVFKVGNNTSSATGTCSTFTFVGDNWLSPAIGTDKVTYTHSAPQQSGTTVTGSDVSPALGGSFTVPLVSYDSKGHIYKNSTYTVTMPSLELTGTKGNNNVMTGLSYNKNSTTMTASYGKIGDLKITGYATKTSISSDVAETDTLNDALGKLRYYISKEVTDRGTAITNAINALDKSDTPESGKYVSSVREENGIITVIHDPFPTASLTTSGLVKITDNLSEDIYSPDVVPCANLLIDLWGEVDSLSTIRDSISYKAMVKNPTTSEITQEEKKLSFSEFVERISLIEKVLVETTNKTLDEDNSTVS